MNTLDKLNELLNGLQGGVVRIGPEAGAKVTQFFLERIQEAKRDDLEPLRRELLTLQMLLENRPGFDVNPVGIGQQLIALGRTVKTIPAPADTPNAAQTLEYLAMTLEQQGRTLVGDIDIATSPDARFANAQASVVGPAGADQVEPGNDYAALRGV